MSLLYYIKRQKGVSEHEKLDDVCDRNWIFAGRSFPTDGKLHGICHFRIDPGVDRGHYDEKEEKIAKGECKYDKIS